MRMVGWVFGNRPSLRLFPNRGYIDACANDVHELEGTRAAVAGEAAARAQPTPQHATWTGQYQCAGQIAAACYCSLPNQSWPQPEGSQ